MTDDIIEQAKELKRHILTSVALECWETAEESGWHGNETFGDKIALMHSELSEALEEFRNGQPLDKIYYSYKDEQGVVHFTDEPANGLTLNKVEGVAAELADVIVRIFDDSVRFKIPIIEALLLKMEYNKTRPHRHGGKLI